MKTPEQWLKQVEKLRDRHTVNFKACLWRENDTVRRKIIEAWAAYHSSIAADKAKQP